MELLDYMVGLSVVGITKKILLLILYQFWTLSLCTNGTKIESIKQILYTWLPNL